MADPLPDPGGSDPENPGIIPDPLWQGSGDSHQIRTHGDLIPFEGGNQLIKVEGQEQ